MCGCVSKKLGFSSSSSSSMKMEEANALFSVKQGIVSVLGSDSEDSSNTAALKSLGRTLSADISSKKWVFEDGISSPMEKIPSSAQICISEINSPPKDGEDENESKSRFDIWASIQLEQKKKQKEEIEEKDKHVSTWSVILSEKPQEDPKTLPPPYVHPLARRSSSLSKESLENCTESLGSETGSDGFSSLSKTGDLEEDRSENVENNTQVQKGEPEVQEERLMRNEELFRVVKHNYLGSKVSERSFPPPIPSLSRQNGASTQMKTRRDHGRLVLEAVSVVSENNFSAQRQDGRLVLTLTDSSAADDDKEQDLNQEMKKKMIFEEVDKEIDAVKEANKKMGFVVEQKGPKFTNGLISFHRLAVVMDKPKGLTYRNPSWPKKFDEMAKLKAKEIEEEREQVMVVENEKNPKSQSMAPFNGHGYYWGAKPTSKDYILNKNRIIVTTARVGEENQQQFVVLTRKGANEVVPLMLKGCKEQKGSFWVLEEPYCIPTS